MVIMGQSTYKEQRSLYISQQCLATIDRLIKTQNKININNSMNI